MYVCMYLYIPTISHYEFLIKENLQNIHNVVNKKVKTRIDFFSVRHCRNALRDLAEESNQQMRVGC